LLVAGPSGAGKSTFLKQLASGRLSADIQNALPAGAKAWVHTDGRKVLEYSGWDDPDGKEVAGCCVHYDMLRPVSSHISSYAQDRSLKLLAQADAVTLVMLTASPDRLAAQLLGRSFGRPGANRLKRLRRVLEVLLPAWLASAKHQARRNWRRRHLALVELYRQPGWLIERYGEWIGFLAASLGPRFARPILYVQAVDSDEGPAFTLVSAGYEGTTPSYNGGAAGQFMSHAKAAG
jgi:hypothetical protein